jgi:hypothetical protein
MRICINRDDSGNFSVWPDDSESSPAAAPQSQQQGAQPDNDTDDQPPPNAQPAPDLKSALMMAAKLLSQPDAEQNSPFDQGMQKTAPTKQPAQGLAPGAA